MAEVKVQLEMEVEKGHLNEQGQNSESENTNDVVNPNSTDLVQDNKLLYNITDVPPWYMCILLGFQHYLTMFGSTVAVPLILSNFLGIENNNVAKGQIISTIFFASGICTLLQTTFGTRLPIVQGAAFSFLAPAIAIMTSIPNPPPNVVNETNSSIVDEPPNNFWKVRMLQVQGAIMVAACTQVFLGLTGLIGFMMSHIGPVTIAPTVALVGLALFGPAGDFAGKHWGIAFLTIGLIFLFSQYLKNIEVPIPSWNRTNGCTIHRVKIFGLFPVIYAILLAWSVCAILTAVGAFPSTEAGGYGYYARTDIRIGVLSESAWFRVPYPGQWGIPIVTLSGVLGMISGVLASIIESVGDYYACARLCYISAPPTHAMNRGILMEGVGCIIAGSLGSGNGTTSYSENIGAIGITKVGSRRVVQTGAVIMIILAVIGKFGALFTTIPDPVVGGMFCVMFGMIAGVGISSLQFVDLNSSRNLLIVGFSMFMGITLPDWVGKNEALISTGSAEGDQVILVLLKTGMFIGGVIAFLLDNTIPGTAEERGLLKWKAQSQAVDQTSDSDAVKVYQFPGFIQKGVNKVDAFKYVPICTTFRSSNLSSIECAKSQKSQTPSQSNDSRL